MRTRYGPIFTLRPYERGIQETLGKYSRFVMPGLGSLPVNVSTTGGNGKGVKLVKEE